jgi:hypothetical protein
VCVCMRINPRGAMVDLLCWQKPGPEKTYQIQNDLNNNY